MSNSRFEGRGSSLDWGPSTSACSREGPDPSRATLAALFCSRARALSAFREDILAFRTMRSATKSRSGTGSMCVSPQSFVEAERFLTQRTSSISHSPPRSIQNFKSGVWDTSTSLFRTDLRCSAKNVANSTSNCEHCSPPHTYSVSPASKTKTSNVVNDSLDTTTSVTYTSRPSLHTWKISGLRHCEGRPASLEKSTGQTLTELCSSRNSSASRILLPPREDQNLSSGLDRTSTPFREKDRRSATNVASSLSMGSAFSPQ
mmetsp:Transcript_41222/g.109085  ORF Transcript_41222/g.109085 Transcript_41222/m.109085 type:complete len:260 (-) Transcript_41222:745-1524(-)